jgi:hypothetical protein
MREFQASGYRYITLGGRRVEPLVDSGWLVWIDTDKAQAWLRAAV